MLTPKQEKFCQCVVSGMTAKDAYIASYDTKASEQVLYNESSKLMLREDIQKRIEDMSKPLIKAAQQTALTEREKKKAIIWEEIAHAREQQDHTAIARYMDILNKMDAEYININKNIDENKENISQLDTDSLKKLVSC